MFTRDFVAAALRKILAPASLGSNPKSMASPDQALPFARIVSDSRQVKSNDLFLALVGDNFDGHDFVPQAIAAGATGIIVAKPITPDQSTDVAVYRVPDTLLAYRALAASWRESFSIPIVAIAGSVGKTTTKEMTAAILSGKYDKVLKTQASENGFVGIPKTLLQLNADHQVAVIEVGIDQVGAMAEHCDLVKPTHSVVTAVAPEHMEFLRDLATVAKEECLILQKTSEFGGIALINTADHYVRPYAHLKGSHTFARVDSGQTAEILGDLQNKANAINGPHGNQEIGNTEQVSIQQADSPPLLLPWKIHGKHNLGNLLAAVAIAKTLGMTTEEIKRGWASYVPLQNRSHVEYLAGGVRIIRDEYNASPASVAAALTMLCDLANGKGRKWFCFADMLELGDLEETYHRELAPFVKKAGVKGVFTLGKRAAFLADTLRQDQESDIYIQECENHREMVQALLSILGKDDTVLLKGSRSMKMEQVWQGLESSFPLAPEASP